MVGEYAQPRTSKIHIAVLQQALAPVISTRKRKKFDDIKIKENIIGGYFKELQLFL